MSGKDMKKIYVKMMSLVVAFAALTGCTSKEAPFFTATEDDLPRILNTDIPEWIDGAPATLMTIKRDANFTFEVVVTPADYTSVTWFLDDVKIHEGKTIDRNILAGDYTLRIVATTTKGHETSRTTRLIVQPLDGDPVPGNDVLERLAAPGFAAVLHGQNMDKVAKVVIGGAEIDAVYADSAVSFTVPDGTADGRYPLTVKDNTGFEYGAGYITVSSLPTVSAGAFSGKSEGSVTISGKNLDKVASVKIGDKAAVITSKDAASLTFTVPALESGDYEMTGVAEDGSAVKFIVGSALAETATFTVTSEVVLWEGSHYVDWGTPFNAIQTSVKEHLAPGRILRGYVNGNGQGTATTAWWNNFTTCLDGEANRGDIMISGSMVLEYVLTEAGVNKLKTEDGLLFVGSGYTITKVTIE